MSLLQRFQKAAPHKIRLPQVQHAMEVLLVEQKGKSVAPDQDLDWEYEHMRESVRWAKILAVRRKLDPDFAACALAIQNIGRVTGGRTEGHAESGYEPARRLLMNLGCFTPVEVEQLACSVANHSCKDRTDTPLDELAKDVDIYVRYSQGHQFTAQHELRRLSAIQVELQTRMNE